MLVIWLAPILAGLAYTGGPFPLTANGLGDPFGDLLSGFIAVWGTIYVHFGQVPLPGWLGGAMMGALVTVLLVVNNMRAYETDRAAGKRAILAHFCCRAGWMEFTPLIAAAYSLRLALIFSCDAPAWILLTILTLQLGTRLIGEQRDLRGPALNHVLGATARLALPQAVLLRLGLVIGAL